MLIPMPGSETPRSKAFARELIYAVRAEFPDFFSELERDFRDALWDPGDDAEKDDADADDADALRVIEAWTKKHNIASPAVNRAALEFLKGEYRRVIEITKDGFPQRSPQFQPGMRVHLGIWTGRVAHREPHARCDLGDPYRGTYRLGSSGLAASLPGHSILGGRPF
jgi:hypothetical protein